VALRLDTSRSLRGYDDQTALAEAIRDASAAEQELDWVEWKTDWDLTSAKGQFQTAKHVLGFANRSVASAERQCDGCAYLVAGVAPQKVVGTAVIDAANLSQALRKYIAPGEPQWSPAYVTIDEKDVLVITVEAPRPGDRIRTLRKTYGNFALGTVFVRRHGQTEQADPIELRSLEDRRAAKADHHVGLLIERADEPSRPLRLLVTDESARASWIASEESSLLNTLPPPPNRSDPFSSLMSFQTPTNVGLGDRRGEDGFHEEVAEYVRNADRRWYFLLCARGFERGVNGAQLVLRNETKENYSEVRVVLSVPDDLTCWSSAEDLKGHAQPPDRPLPYGADTIGNFASALVPRGALRQHVQTEPEVEASRTPKAEVVFTIPQVRPGYTIELPHFFVLGNDAKALGEVREFRWSLTTRSHSGDAEGTIRYTIAPNPIDLAPEIATDQTLEAYR
jgi:hypothetical protein